jgi:hypothetical protein
MLSEKWAVWIYIDRTLGSINCGPPSNCLDFYTSMMDGCIFFVHVNSKHVHHTNILPPIDY